MKFKLIIIIQNQQRELTVRHARETEKEMKKRLDVQKEEYEEAIKRHLSFIDQVCINFWFPFPSVFILVSVSF